MEIDTTEKQIHNEQYSYDTAQEENMDTFYENDYIITHYVFLGYPEAANPEFHIGDDWNDKTDAADSMYTLSPFDFCK